MTIGARTREEVVRMPRGLAFVTVLLAGIRRRMQTVP